ncbi:hypothetical protein HY490_00860 [Candidatus Woesearchaeota archaeon]|nr:hypothetical protein [Candidatus Woesearchaeota archaeon]
MIFQIAVSVSNIVNALQQFGFLDFVIPVILIFAIVFALLEQLGIFGGNADEKRKYNTIIALSIALLVAIPHAINPRPDDAIGIIQKYLPEFVFLALALILVFMLLGVVGAKMPFGGLLTAVLGLLAVGYFVLSVVGAAAGFRLPSVFPFLLDPNFVAIMIVIIVFGIVVYYVAGPTGAPKTWTQSIGEAGEFFDKLLGRK